MCSDSEKNMSAFADQNHAPSLTCVQLEKYLMNKVKKNPGNGILFDFFVNNSVMCRKSMVYLFHIFSGVCNRIPGFLERQF